MTTDKLLLLIGDGALGERRILVAYSAYRL